MAAEDFDRLAPHLVSTDLPLGKILEEAGEASDDVHFLRSGVASIIICHLEGKRVDLGLLGREAVCGRSNMIDVPESGVRVEMCMAGASWAMPTEEFRNALNERPALSFLVGRFFYIFHLQVKDTLITTACSTVLQRLARLLLMLQDRVGDDLQITHNQIAYILGCRRPGATLALQILEGTHAICSRRKRVLILDRPQLIQLTEGAYGRPEAAFERLIPVQG